MRRGDGGKRHLFYQLVKAASNLDGYNRARGVARLSAIRTNSATVAIR